MEKETPLKKFIEKYSENLPSEFNFLDKDQRTINKADAIDDEEILIEDILNENKINIVSKDNNTIIKENNSDNKILINEPKQKLEQKNEIKIYINNEVKTIKKLNKEVKLIEVRKMLSNIMSEKAYFTKGEIKIDDEEDFSLKEIIKEESIFIIDNYIVHKENNIEENLLNNNSYQEKSNEEFKIMSIIENGKIIKSKKINIKESLSELRSMLDLPLNASFLNNGADIDIKDETIFNISDIMKDNQIFIKREESQQYIIYLNNQILTKQNLEPSKDLASLRNLLSLQINEKAYFINAITKERINNEDEQFQLLSKISNNNNEIFMEQEVEIKKKVTEVIKGSELIDQIGQLKIYKYNCVPQKYVDELIEKKKIQNYDEYNGEIFDINDEAESKTIIVLGQTGSGKTTLLNSLVNFILGVEFEDDFRYVIIDEKNVQGNEVVDQKKSVTQNTSIYYIKKYKDFPSIILIDTPGFGDTSGPDKDQLIIKDIKNTFEKN